MDASVRPAGAKGSRLSGGALTEEALDSSASVYERRGPRAQAGLQQYFSPPEAAALAAKVMGAWPHSPYAPCVLDPTAGDGALIGDQRPTLVPARRDDPEVALEETCLVALASLRERRYMAWQVGGKGYLEIQELADGATYTYVILGRRCRRRVGAAIRRLRHVIDGWRVVGVDRAMGRLAGSAGRGTGVA